MKPEIPGGEFNHLGKHVETISQELLPWGIRRPYLIRDARIFRPSMTELTRGVPAIEEDDGEPRDLIEPLHQRMQDALQWGFDHEDCKTIDWQPEWDKDNNYRITTEQNKFATLTHTINIGELPWAVKEVLRPTAWRKTRIFGAEFLEKLAKDLPESFPSVLDQRSRKSQKLPDVVNIIYVRDDENLIADLHRQGVAGDAAADQLFVAFNRVLMLKLGSFRTILVSYRVDERGEAQADLAILGTLEGGHPGFAFNSLEQMNELARRLKILSSTMAIKTEVDTDKIEMIDPEYWHNSPTVKGVQELGRFLGRRRLLSPPVHLRMLSNRPELIAIAEEAAGYSRQAEGAFGLWDPVLDKFVVTSTGKMGAVKSKLSTKDMVAIVQTFKDGKRAVNKVKVGDEVFADPSVEAEEFAFPIWDLADKFRFRTTKVDDGYRPFGFKTQRGYLLEGLLPFPNGYRRAEQLSDGLVDLPPIVGVVHIHRGIKHFNPDKIIRIDTTKFAPVGCGVDAMHEMSDYVMKEAFRQAQEIYHRTGRLPKCAIFDVPNHGVNALIFPSADEKTGLIPENFADIFINAVKNGDIVYKYTVDQR